MSEKVEFLVLLAGGVLACAGWLQWATRLSFALALPGASWPASSDSSYSAWDLRSPLATKAKGSVRRLRASCTARLLAWRLAACTLRATTQSDCMVS